MATTPVEIKVEGFVSREVIETSYSFSQGHESGKTTGKPKGGTINLTLKALNNDPGKNEILSWMLNDSLLKKGEIVFKDTLDSSVMRTVKFEDASCVNYTLDWAEAQLNQVVQSDNLLPPTHTEKIVIACRKIEIVGVDPYENKWEGAPKPNDNTKAKNEDYNKQTTIGWKIVEKADGTIEIIE